LGVTYALAGYPASDLTSCSCCRANKDRIVSKMPRFLLAILTMVGISGQAPAANAQAAPQAVASPTAAEMLDALKHRGATRGSAAAPVAGAPTSAAQPAPKSELTAAERQSLVALLAKSRKTRGLSEPELAELGTIAASKPSIDLTINFEFNSADIAKSAMPTVIALGQALSNAELADASFLVAGHTDGKGADTYNQALSMRRAQAIRTFLIENFKIPEKRLDATGFGKTQLKNATAPFADENRRVQVVNLGNIKP
jgi:outer membrane protein OmpA-like peptidoglycan-associated protein